MQLFTVALFLLVAISTVFAAPNKSKTVGIPISINEVEIELGLVENLKNLLEWMAENDISISDIFSSEFFNSDLFNSDIFNQEYFNHEFFSSELFNSEIFNSENFTKVLYSLYGVAGSGTGTLNRDNAVQLISFFESKDWQGLKAYLTNLPTPPPTL